MPFSVPSILTLILSWQVADKPTRFLVLISVTFAPTWRLPMRGQVRDPYGCTDPFWTKEEIVRRRREIMRKRVV